MANILLATHIYPPAVDGGSKVIVKFGEYLQKHGHQVLILTSNCRSTDDFTHPYKAVHNIGLPVYTLFHKPLKLFSKVLSKGPIFRFIPFIKFLFTCIRFHPDYIIAGPLPTTIILYAKFFKKITGARLLINASFHQTDPEFSQPILLSALRSADFIWTLTDFETNYFHKNLNIPLSKLINVGNGVDQNFLKFLPSSREDAPAAAGAGGFDLLFIGSFSAHKGIATLIKAFCLLKNDYYLTLAGQKTLYSPVIEDIINNLPPIFRSRINVVYNFPNSKLLTLIDSCSVLISPSTQESFGLVLIESLARNKPVIAADIPASSEIVTKSKGGLLFKVGKPQDLASKINLLFRTKNDFGLNGYRYVKDHYTWDRIGEALWQKISS
jgi:glycosyltransferase involved in cell wall biosynthesis